MRGTIISPSPSAPALQTGRIKTAATPRDFSHWKPQDARSATVRRGGPVKRLGNRLHTARTKDESLELFVVLGFRASVSFTSRLSIIFSLTLTHRCDDGQSV